MNLSADATLMEAMDSALDELGTIGQGTSVGV